ncbi:MAG: hypothetical protein A2Z26_02430 [Deltaproteobacteria bacterium RBG_16_66_15]|nr:MAG: hypothetical protein A2Z26_02430 [Deltaproteobacteria bacterium RBG_16_66_15]
MGYRRVPPEDDHDPRIPVPERERLASREREGLAVLSGWRLGLLGKELLALLDGRLSLVIHKGEVVVEERSVTARDGTDPRHPPLPRSIPGRNSR